jgi:hypothetical protein
LVGALVLDNFLVALLIESWGRIENDMEEVGPPASVTERPMPNEFTAPISPISGIPAMPPRLSKEPVKRVNDAFISIPGTLEPSFAVTFFASIGENVDFLLNGALLPSCFRASKKNVRLC